MNMKRKRTEPKLKSITVARLIDLLQGEDPEAEVVFVCDYGDHGHTEQALPIRGDIIEAVLEPSAYSISGWAVASDDDEPEYMEESVLVVR